MTIVGDRPQGVAGDCNSLAFIATKADQVANQSQQQAEGLVRQQVTFLTKEGTKE